MGESVESIVFRSLWVSGTATILAASWSLPLAYLAVVWRRLGAVLVPVAEALVGVPTVLVGLLLYMLLSRQGPLGFLNLLYTPYAVIVGEAVLVTPLIVATSYRVLRAGYEAYGELAYSLGATGLQAAVTVLSHSLPGVVASLVMGFSRAIGELGVAFIVGGNIAGLTRTMTTAIALEVSMGEYEDALLLGGVLAGLTVLVSAVARLVVRRYEVRG